MNAFLLVLAINVINGNVQPIASLRGAPANGWIGYSMTAREPLNVSCCDGWGNYTRCDGCRIDRDGGLNITRHDRDDLGPVGDTHLLLFAHFDNGTVDRVRVFGPSCQIDLGGHTVNWIDNVSGAESIEFLRNAVDRGENKARNGGLLALSLHEGATDALIDLARNNPDREVRGRALFWLSQQAGRKAAEALKDAVENDPEESVRGKAVFGISQLPNDESIPLLIDLLKHNKSRAVRKKAAFWLGQKNDPRALAAIEDILKDR